MLLMPVTIEKCYISITFYRGNFETDATIRPEIEIQIWL